MRRPIPAGQAGLIVLAAAAVPVVLKACKPFTKKLGEGMERFGQKLKEYAEEGTAKPSDAAKADVKGKGSTKETAPAKSGVNERAATPTGKPEVEANETAADLKTDTPPEGLMEDRKKAEYRPKPDQPLNPKRTKVTPPKASSAKKPRKKNDATSSE